MADEEKKQPEKRGKLWAALASVGVIVGGLAVFSKDLDEIKKFPQIIWDAIYSKPELKFRDIRFDLTQQYPIVPYGQKPEPDNNPYRYIVRIGLVVEKASVEAIGNCEGELSYIFETQKAIAKEFSILRRGKYDQPATYEFNVAASNPINEFDFRFLCDGVVSRWYSQKNAG